MSDRNAYHLIDSPFFEERLNFLKESQYWDVSKIESFQLLELQKQLFIASNFVPFYIDFFREKNLRWTDFRCLDDIKLLPIITKKDIRRDYLYFMNAKFNQNKLINRSTGGSSGSSLAIYSDDIFISKDKANTFYYMDVLGLNPFKDRSVRLYGDVINEELIKNGIYWEQKNERQLVVSCWHINHETAEHYYKKLQSFSPAYIHTRPSAIYSLAKTFLKLGFPPLTIPFVITDGEYLLDEQRKLIRKVFSCSVKNIFGHTEGSAVGHPCLQSNKFHFMPQVGYLEVVRLSSHASCSLDEMGRIIVTGFNNAAMPLIRYDTGDLGVWGGTGCECGRNYPIVTSIEGRVQDFVVGREGNFLPLAPAVFNYHDLAWSGVEEFQVIQSKVGELELLLRLEDRVLLVDQQKILENLLHGLSKLFQGSFLWTGRLVDEITKSKLGKHRYLKQNLNISDYMT